MSANGGEIIEPYVVVNCETPLVPGSGVPAAEAMQQTPSTQSEPRPPDQT